MNLTTAMALALFLGQAQADGSPPPATATEQAPVLPADATGPAITLDEALQAAEERNLDLKALAAQLDEAAEITWKALSLYLPQVTAGASYTLQDEVKVDFPFGLRQANPTPPGIPPGIKAYDLVGLVQVEEQRNGMLGAQLQVTQVLVSPRLYFTIGGAKESQRATVLSIENGRRQVLFGVARAYYGAAALNEALGVAYKLLEIAQRQEKDARVRYQAGPSPRWASSAPRSTGPAPRRT
jgi:outer membrane protein TolC